MTVVQSSQSNSSDHPAVNERRYAYAPGFFMLIVGVIFFGGGGLMMAHAAATNQRGLIIDGIIHLSPEHACTFYLMIAAGCFCFVSVLLVYTLPQNFIARRIVLGDDAITLPGSGFDTAHYELSPAEITSFKINVVKNRRFLKIYAADRSFPVNPMWLADQAAFGDILSWLQTHVPSLRAQMITPGRAF